MADLDPIEEMMGKAVGEMTAAELVSYMRTALGAYGIDYVSDGLTDRKTLESLIKRYPNGKAGKIVQHVMIHCEGKKDGSYVSPYVFSQKMKWWTDKMWAEAQKYIKDESEWESQREEVESGWFDAREL